MAPRDDGGAVLYDDAVITRRTRRATLGLLTLGGAVVATYGCRDATQVTLAVSTAKVTCGALMGVRITVAGNVKDAEDRAGGDFVTATAACPDPAGQDVGTLVITPGDSGNAAIVIVSSLVVDPRTCKPPSYQGCVVARRSLSFRDHVSATIPVVLDPACADVPCDVSTTCKQGECITSRVDCNDEGECVSPDPRGRVEDDASVIPFDAGRVDAPVDGPSEAGADGADGATDGSDGGDDGSTAGCISACPDSFPANVSCTPATGQLCCYVQSSTLGMAYTSSVSCQTRAACKALDPHNGISTCCRTDADCNGKRCCFRRDLMKPAMHPEPSGETYCADKCMGTENMCNSAAMTQCTDPEGSGNACVPIGATAYTGPLYGCQP